MNNVEKTHQRAKDLDSDVKDLLKKIQGKYYLLLLLRSFDYSIFLLHFFSTYINIA